MPITAAMPTAATVPAAPAAMSAATAVAAESQRLLSADKTAGKTKDGEKP
jgi:hypothetical protein